MEEKRKYPRIKGVLPLKLFVSECDVITETRNVSGNGAYCAVDRPLEPMTKLSMVLLVPSKKGRIKAVKKITCKGVVVRSEHVKDNGHHSYCVGIYFSEIKESDRKTLLSYIDSLAQTKPPEPAQEP
ncbi:MAG: PilZ domain-containing protein [Candidatus Omnitrophota bacterium]